MCIFFLTKIATRTLLFHRRRFCLGLAGPSREERLRLPSYLPSFPLERCQVDRPPLFPPSSLFPLLLLVQTSFAARRLHFLVRKVHERRGGWERGKFSLELFGRGRKKRQQMTTLDSTSRREVYRQQHDNFLVTFQRKGNEEREICNTKLLKVKLSKVCFAAPSISGCRAHAVIPRWMGQKDNWTDKEQASCFSHEEQCFNANLAPLSGY